MSTEANKTTKNGSIGLTYPMLDRSNYTAWAMKMKVFIKAQGAWIAIEPKDPKAEVDDKIDQIALAMIYQGIPEGMLLSLADKDTAKGAWEAIKTLCQGADKVKNARVQTLKAEFEGMTMKEDETIDDFHMKLNGVVTNIRALGEKMDESYTVKKLLRAVPSKFLHITSTIEQFGNLDTMTMEEAVGSLKAHEERVKGKMESKESRLLLTEEEWAKREKTEGKLLLTREEWLKRSTKEGAKEGSSNYKTRLGRFDKSSMKCYNCNIYGHIASECRRPKKNRDTRQEAHMAQVDDDEPTLLLAKCVKEEGVVMLTNENKAIHSAVIKNNNKAISSNVWYLDNGASNHMTGFREKFTDLDETITGVVHFGDNSTVKIEGKGTVTMLCKNGEKKYLFDVYYIPSLCNNIISLGQMSEDGNKVVLKGDLLWIYDEKERPLMKVKRSSNRLYKLIIETDKKECLLAKMDETSKLWHLRLGHVNYQAMHMMTKEQMVTGMPKINQPSSACDGCLMSKQARKKFPSKTSYEAGGILELIHGDLCGPITPETASGYRYFFLLVDDYSRFMWVYFLKSKDEAFKVFKCFRAQVEKSTERKIKVLRTDRGGEFTSKDFKDYCESAGIERHYTTPYTPQQNGVVERRNRTIVEMARSCMKETNLPKRMWGEAVRHSVYILNRVPTRALTNLTPYEARYKRKPNLSYIRVFGCLAYMKTSSKGVRKLDDRSKRVINLGKEPGTKGYRLYDPDNDQVSVSRDVTFEELESWPWNETGNEREVTEQFDVQLADESDCDAQSPPIEEPEENFSQGDTPPTPNDRSTMIRLNPEDYNDSHEPKNQRLLSDIYEATEEIRDELNLMGVDEPGSFKHAVKDDNWKQAMEQEMESIKENDTWELTKLPPGKKIIGLKWVYKLKKDAEGRIVRYKARLVAKGYAQEQGVDYDEVYAPVTRLETVRLLLALSAKKNWGVHHLDVKTAFLNGDIKEDVYVAQPEGFEKTGKEGFVYKLKKALYGLRQAPRAWYAKLSSYLEKLGFVKCPYEPAVYVRKEHDEMLIVAVYVDDLLITGSSKTMINKFKAEMNQRFQMNDLGRLSYYLGIEVEQKDGCIVLKQSGYARKILEKVGMMECNPTTYPMDPKVLITSDESGEAVDATMFKSMVGGLRYLLHTRPDISFSVGVVSRYMERPTKIHLEAVKRIMRYVKGTIHYGLVYSEDSRNNVLNGFCDSDLAGHLDDRRSTSGMVFYLNESVITWVSQKQRCVALSSCEAEFMAATAAACQAVWLRNVLSQITSELIGPVKICIDNRSAIDLAKNPVFHGRSKHIDVRYHFIRECVERGEVILQHVSSNEQRADIMTKALIKNKFEDMRKLLGVKNLVEHV